MSHNNATEGAEVNVECEKAMTTSLLDLNDFALLHVFSYLNLRDSIHLAGTTKRLKSVGALHFTKYKRMDLLKYELCDHPKKLPVETILSHIGQHIKTLSIDSMRLTVAEAVMNNCVNVTTLEINDCDDTSEWNKWMQQLKLKSLTIKYCRDFHENSVALAALKELHFSGSKAGLKNILEKTTALETLTVDLRYSNFNYAIFNKLPKLQCLDIEIYSENLVNLTEYLKMDVLTQFKICISIYEAECLQRLNCFLEILAERSKLDELQLVTDMVDRNTFRILKSFHVTSLGFCAFHCVDHKWDECWMVHQLVVAQPNLKLLNLPIKPLPIEHVDFVIKNLVKLETFNFCMGTQDLEQSDDLRLNEMLKTTTSRPMLTLYKNSGYEDGVKIELRFEQRKHRIVQLDRNDSYFLTDSFTR